MKTVEFKTADGRTRYYLAGENGLPAKLVLKFLRFRDAVGYARNTLRGECIHLIHYFEFLEKKGKAYEEVSIDDLARFFGRLKNPDIEKNPITQGKANGVYQEAESYLQRLSLWDCGQ